ncbi:MAG: deoxyribodipyrimidine photo-lyase [Bacteroidota bacterium]
MSKVSIFWFRRDLRLEDNCGLFHALKGDDAVQPIFIFDRDILDELNDDSDARVHFIHGEISRLAQEIAVRGGSLDVRYGHPLEIWKQLLEDYEISALYANRDYEPYARERDKAVYELLESQGIPFISKKDQVFYEKSEVLKADGAPYVVYTPYSRLWKERFKNEGIPFFDSSSIQHWNPGSNQLISLEAMGFKPSTLSFPGRTVDLGIVKNYHNTRNTPSKPGTTRLSVHLRFGTISIRELIRQTADANGKYLNELIWRDFYSSILWHFPHVAKGNFNKKYDRVAWRNDEEEFHRWCKGETGYPIVDAGMRELNNTGYMHNRVRMIVASFLTKHLLVDWRWGEAYFAEKLLDFDLTSNNGGWQWAAGTGVDAAPYFRIFNPYSQTDKFDPKKKYIEHWVPEYDSAEYPEPIVDHKAARERALETYKAALS